MNELYDAAVVTNMKTASTEIPTPGFDVFKVESEQHIAALRKERVDLIADVCDDLHKRFPDFYQDLIGYQNAQKRIEEINKQIQIEMQLVPNYVAADRALEDVIKKLGLTFIGTYYDLKDWKYTATSPYKFSEIKSKLVGNKNVVERFSYFALPQWKGIVIAIKVAPVYDSLIPSDFVKFEVSCFWVMADPMGYMNDGRYFNLEKIGTSGFIAGASSSTGVNDDERRSIAKEDILNCYNSGFVEGASRLITEALKEHYDEIFTINLKEETSNVETE